MTRTKRTDYPFYHGASLEIIRRAAVLRKNTTETEKLLWSRISKSQLNGTHFRRQHPIGKFVVDFYCHEALLVIELDGEVHGNLEVAERDEGRELELKKKGLTVIRFSNHEVVNDIESVLREIQKFIRK